MDKAQLILIIAVLSGCSITPYAGLSIHAPAADEPEFSASNPLGHIGVKHERGPYTGYCQHTSALFVVDDGRGLNECGIRREFDLR